MGASPGTVGAGKSEQPVRTVTIGKSIGMARTEVTVGQWKACLAGGGCLGYDPGANGIDTSDDELPIGMIPYAAAESYVTWLSLQTRKRYRLPSEAEWEFAARGGTTTAYWWGDAPRRGVANCSDCGTGLSTPTVHEVGRYPPNNFGLYDMNGNLWEWVQDCSNPNYRGAPSDGSAWLEGDCDRRIIRSGGFGGPVSTLRSANRNAFNSGGASTNASLGFRVVRALD